MMKHETARQLLELLLRHGKEQNDALSTLSKVERDDDLKKIKTMIGRTMGSLYLDAVYPILTEHPDLTPIELQKPQ